ncbi:hypothetical protein L9F63_020408, partial [Diploptera punctata]
TRALPLSDIAYHLEWDIAARLSFVNDKCHSSRFSSNIFSFPAVYCKNNRNEEVKSRERPFYYFTRLNKYVYRCSTLFSYLRPYKPKTWLGEEEKEEQFGMEGRRNTTRIIIITRRKCSRKNKEYKNSLHIPRHRHELRMLQEPEKINACLYNNPNEHFNLRVLRNDTTEIVDICVIFTVSDSVYCCYILCVLLKV